MDKLPSLPEAEPRDAQDVLDFAERIEAFANKNADDLNNQVQVELAATLDVYSQRLLTRKPIIVSGIYKLAKPFPNDPFTIEHELVEGLFEGPANGFSVFDIEHWEHNAADSSEQERLYDEVRARTPGQFAVAFLVRNTSVTGGSEDLSVISNNDYNVVAPFRSNDIFIPGTDEYEPEATYHEARAIISALDPRSRLQVRQVIEELSQGEPLQALIRACSPTHKFLAHNHGEIQRQALAEIIGYHAPKELFTTIYTTDSLPPVYYDTDHSSDITRVELPFKQIAFEEIMLRDRYFLREDGTVVVPPKSPPGLFVGAIASYSPWGQTFKFHIPIEHLNPQIHKLHPLTNVSA